MRLKDEFALRTVWEGKTAGELDGRYELTLSGSLDGRPWSQPAAGGPRPIQLRQSMRLEGFVEYPAQAIVKALSVKVTDARGSVLATYSVKI